MRAKYYMRLFGQMKYKKSFVPFITIIVIMVVLFILLIKKFVPIIEAVCSNYTKALGVQITEETVRDLIKEVDYNQLMNINYNADGKIVAISANVVKMNELASNIVYEMQKRLNNIDKVTVRVPMGELIGLNIFSGYGPNIKLKVVPMGIIETKFNSKFVSEGINQTKHTIYMDIKSIITIVAPFIGNNVVCDRTVTIAETVIIGDIPNTYYNIQGLEDVNKTGALELIED